MNVSRGFSLRVGNQKAHRPKWTGALCMEFGELVRLKCQMAHYAPGGDVRHYERGLYTWSRESARGKVRNLGRKNYLPV